MYSVFYNVNWQSLFDKFVKDKKDTFIRIVKTTIEGNIIITDIICEEESVIFIIDNTRNKYSNYNHIYLFIKKYDCIEEKININENDDIRELIVYNNNQKDNYKVILSLYAFID